MLQPGTIWRCRHRDLRLGHGPLLMGIINVTPDSFSDGNPRLTPETSIQRALTLIEDGADIIDIGGESTRPGAAAVNAEEELARVLPVVEGIREQSDIPISVDTTKAVVAQRALELGADIVNDVSALTADPNMAAVVARFGAGVVLMHMKGTPRTMQSEPVYDDVVAEVRQFLEGRIRALTAQGLDPTRFAIDPGIGFGKTVAHNIALIAQLNVLLELGRPVLVGVSRKSFIGTLLGRDVQERLAGSLGALLTCAKNGASIMRVHDVRASRDILNITGHLNSSEILRPGMTDGGRTKS